jgi:hypothetical protein
LFSYTEPPQYDGVEYSEEGVPRCRVKITIPQHPSRSLWQPIEIDVVDHRLANTFEAVALEAINIFCDQHPDEVVRYPIGLFPTADFHDPEWTFRLPHFGHLLGDFTEETLRAIVRFMNAQYHHQIIQRCGMSQMTSIAQGYRRNINRQISQIEELQYRTAGRNHHSPRGSDH